MAENFYFTSPCVGIPAEKLSSLRIALTTMKNRVRKFLNGFENENNNLKRRIFDDVRYDRFVEFFREVDRMDDELFTRTPALLKDRESVNRLKCVLQWAERFVVIISQVLLYEAALQLESFQMERIEIVTVKNFVWLDYNSHQFCTEASCRPYVETKFKPGENLLCLPFKHGYRRGIVRSQQGANQVVYVAPCGVVIDSPTRLKQFLHETQSSITPRAFSFSVKIEPRRRYVIPSNAVKHRVYDLTNGRELRIGCVNELDDESVSIANYVTKPIFKNPFKIPVNDVDYRCTCTGDCSSTKSCECRRKTGDASYDYFGRLSQPIGNGIFECGRFCACNVDVCCNRITQNDRSSLLELFKTESKGWGVKSLVDLPKGEFVSVCGGAIVPDAVAENYGQYVSDSYLFDIPPLVRNNDGTELARFALDAAYNANVARFFNHSCQPNMFLQPIFWHELDRRFPTLALFTSTTVRAGDELSWHYRYPVGMIEGRCIECRCGSRNCTGRML